MHECEVRAVNALQTAVERHGEELLAAVEAVERHGSAAFPKLVSVIAKTLHPSTSPKMVEALAADVCVSLALVYLDELDDERDDELDDWREHVRELVQLHRAARCGVRRLESRRRPPHLRRARCRETRVGRNRRLRCRSGSRGDPPDEPDDDLDEGAKR